MGEKKKPIVANNLILGSLFTSCAAETREAEAEKGQRAGFGDFNTYVINARMEKSWLSTSANLT